MGTWSTTTSLIATSYYNIMIGSYHDEALSVGGWVGGAPSVNVYKFDGATWASTSSLTVARISIFGAGCTGNAMSFGGYTGSNITFNTVERFFGSSWATTNSLLSARGFGGHLAGSNPNAGTMAVAGMQNGGAAQTTNEYWNGSSWAITSLLNTMRTGSFCSGDMNSGMCCGAGTLVEKWSGTAWATTDSMGKSRFQHGVSGSSANDTLAYGGYSGAAVCIPETEKWSGSSWMTVATWTAAQGMYGSGFCGGGGSALVAGGYNTSTGSPLTQVIRYRSDGDGSFRVWSLTGNLNISRIRSGYFGDTSSSIVASGVPSSGGYSTTSELWSGSSWSTTSNVNVAAESPVAFGDTTSAIMAAGYSGSFMNRTERWTGTSWSTTGSNINTARYAAASAGNATAGLMFGGYTGANIGTTEKWNGSSWQTTSSLSYSCNRPAGFGVTSAAICAGGYYTSGAFTTCQIWSGASWATTTALNLARYGHAGSGTTSSGILSGGGVTSPMLWDTIDSCEHWTGTAWSVRSALNVGRTFHSHTGTEALGLVTGGMDQGQGFIYPYTEISSSSSVDSAYYTLSGEVDISSVPTGNRTVRLYNRQTGNLFGSTTSNPVDGTFSFTVPDGNTRYFALAFPSTGESYNAAVLDNIQPKTHTATWMYGGAWTTTNGLILPRQQAFVVGVTSRALSIAGYTGSTPVNNVETWNGSVWGTTSNVSTARYGHSVLGSGYRAIAVSGYSSGNLLTSEYYNGTSWASTTAVSANRTYAGYVGAASSGIVCGGINGNTNAPNDYTYTWNGTSWTNTCGMLIPQSLVATLGNQSTAIAAGGRKGGNNQELYYQGERWDSTVWSITSPHIYAGYVFGAVGSTNRGLSGGGYVRATGIKTAAIWNGSSWATTVDQNQSIQAALCGCCDSALMTPNASQGEIFRQYYSITGIGTWSTAAGTLVTGKAWMGHVGNTVAALAVSGWSGATPPITDNEIWTSSSWATTTSYPVGTYTLFGVGDTSSAMMIGGATGTPSAVSTSVCQVWTASSWSTTTNLPAGRSYVSGVGSTNTTVICKGNTTGTVGTIDSLVWTSPTWSTTSAANVPAYAHRCCGTTSAAFSIGGIGYSTLVCSDVVEKWDGSSWALTTPLLAPARGLSAVGTTSSCILYGCNIADAGNARLPKDSFIWTGTVWSMTTGMNTARWGQGGCGSGTESAMAFGGYTSEDVTLTPTTEIWSYA